MTLPRPCSCVGNSVRDGTPSPDHPEVGGAPQSCGRGSGIQRDDHNRVPARSDVGGITAFFLGIMIFLIYAMDHPLQGAVSVPPDAFQSVYDQVMKWDEAA
jgi:hypothetical protein